MRVLLTTPRLDPAAGGLPVAVAGLADALDEAGVAVRLAAPPTPEPVLPRRPGVTVDLVAPGGWGHYLGGVRADLVHDNGLWVPLHHAVARAAGRRAWPRLVSLHGMLVPRARRHNALRKRVAWALRQRRELDTARALHVVTDAEAVDVCALGLRPPVAVVPNGVGLPALAPRAAPDGPRDGPRRALYLGRLHPMKGADVLVEAWAAARRAGALEGWVLDVAGPDEGGFRAVLEEAVAASGTGDTVRFLGPLAGETKEKALAAADVLVLPSRTESFGMAAAEALAHGVPVVAMAGPWAHLPAEGAGWWVPPGPDPPANALAAALRAAAAVTDDERRAMGLRGRALVERAYAWPTVAARMAAVYRWLLGGARPPDVRPCPPGRDGAAW